MPRPATLSDRFGIAMANLMLALPTGALLWVLLNGWPWDWIGWLPAWTIAAFAGAMTLLGAAMKQNALLGIYQHCWKLIADWFRA